MDQTGLIGVHRDVDYTTMTTDTQMLCGAKLFAEMTDGIVKGAISAAATAKAAKA